MSGGGYGPLVTAGQIVVDREPKQAVASTSLSEAITCVASLIIYLIAGETINFEIAFSLLIGAILAVPLAVLTVKKVSTSRMKPVVGITCMLLGLFMLFKLFFM